MVYQQLVHRSTSRWRSKLAAFRQTLCDRTNNACRYTALTRAVDYQEAWPSMTI